MDIKKPRLLASPADLPYLNQSPEVRAYFDELKSRQVILEVKDVGKTFASEQGKTEALRHISFEVHQREFICVVGPS